VFNSKQPPVLVSPRKHDLPDSTKNPDGQPLNPERLVVKELKAELQKRGLEVKGNKPSLIERLTEAIQLSTLSTTTPTKTTTTTTGQFNGGGSPLLSPSKLSSQKSVLRVSVSTPSLRIRPIPFSPLEEAYETELKKNTRENASVPDVVVNGKTVPPEDLTVAQLKNQIISRGGKPNGLKRHLVNQLRFLLNEDKDGNRKDMIEDEETTKTESNSDSEDENMNIQIKVDERDKREASENAMEFTKSSTQSYDTKVEKENKNETKSNLESLPTNNDHPLEDLSNNTTKDKNDEQKIVDNGSENSSLSALEKSQKSISNRRSKKTRPSSITVTTTITTTTTKSSKKRKRSSESSPSTDPESPTTTTRPSKRQRVSKEKKKNELNEMDVNERENQEEVKEPKKKRTKRVKGKKEIKGKERQEKKEETNKENKDVTTQVEVQKPKKIKKSHKKGNNSPDPTMITNNHNFKSSTTLSNDTYTINDSYSPPTNTTQPNTTQPNTTQPNTTQSNTTQSNTTQPNTTQSNSLPLSYSPDSSIDSMSLELNNSETSSCDTKEEDTKMCDMDLKIELDLVLKQYEVVTQRMNDLTNENLLLKERIHKVVNIFNRSRKV